MTGEDLCLAWQKYMKLFGEAPHGTARQLSALLAFVPKPIHEKESEQPPKAEEKIKRLIHAANELLAVSQGLRLDAPMAKAFDDLWEAVIDIRPMFS